MNTQAEVYRTTVTNGQECKLSSYLYVVSEEPNAVGFDPQGSHRISVGSICKFSKPRNGGNLKLLLPSNAGGKCGNQISILSRSTIKYGGSVI